MATERIPQEIIRCKRQGRALDRAQIDAFVTGLVDGSWQDAQVAALAMAICLNGASPSETVALTHAMTHSGEVLDWAGADLGGPILDKHSTGGVGDKVSLLLAPIVAACGGVVPMLSGRGLGHTGGTLDKLDSIPGYQTEVGVPRLLAALRSAGCAIVGATRALAPADRRLYDIRGLTATVESVPLITASILSKKLAGGVQGLVMDIKTGNGAFASELTMARELAASIARVAAGAGLPTRIWITDMSQVLGTSCGHALEVAEAVALLAGATGDPRLREVTRSLSAELLLVGGLAADLEDAGRRVDAVLAGGQALERFERMVAALGGPADVATRAHAHLPVAPVCRPFRAARAGWVGGMDTRGIGLLVLELGGGRRRAGDSIDPRVGLAAMCPIGLRVEAGSPLAMVHAADEASAAMACSRLATLIQLDPMPPTVGSVLIERW